MPVLSPVMLRNLHIDPPIALAPMVALSHSALRSLILEYGGAGVFYTEMLSIKRLPSETPKHSPLLVTTDEETPLIYQLVGNEPERLPAAIAKVHLYGGAGIDLNLGCPAPQLCRQGAGAALVNDRPRLLRMLRVLRLETELPLSVKIRLGPEEDRGFLAGLCRMLEDEGVDALTVHARRPGEKFCRKPQWSLVGEAKESVSIPVFVNGGIFSVDDARQALARSGADGLMIGRGAVVRPWLCGEIAAAFSEKYQEKNTVNMEKMYYRFITLLEERFAPQKRLSRLKHFTRYYSRSFQFGHSFWARVQSSDSMDEAKAYAESFFASTGKEELQRRVRC